MDIFQIVGVALIGLLLVQTLKGQVPQVSMILTLMTCVLIIFMILPNILLVKEIVNHLSTYVSGDEMYISIIFKIIGIAYISEFASAICNDAGESAISNKIELAGKMIILVISSPIIFTLLELIVTIV